MKIFPASELIDQTWAVLDREAQLVIAAGLVDAVADRQRRGEPIPTRLNDACICISKLLAKANASSQARTNSEGALSLSDAKELIGVAEAARIVGVSKRWVQHEIASDLGGRRVSGRWWVFEKAVVEEYANERSEQCS